MDPMILISLISGLGFAYLGNWMARRRDAHRMLWTMLGFLFPPLLLTLKLMHWTPEPREGGSDSEEEGETLDPTSRSNQG